VPDGQPASSSISSFGRRPRSDSDIVVDEDPGAVVDSRRIAARSRMKWSSPLVAIWKACSAVKIDLRFVDRVSRVRIEDFVPGFIPAMMNLPIVGLPPGWMETFSTERGIRWLWLTSLPQPPAVQGCRRWGSSRFFLFHGLDGGIHHHRRVMMFMSPK